MSVLGDGRGEDCPDCDNRYPVNEPLSPLFLALVVLILRSHDVLMGLLKETDF